MSETEAVSRMKYNAVAMQVGYWEELRRPFYLLRPKLFRDGNQWCAIYGEDLHRGVAGFGNTPEQAAMDFDRAWLGEKP